MSDSRHRKTPLSGVFSVATRFFGQSAPPALQADVSGFKSLHGVLRRLGEALALPDWYGGNLDALLDCLCDKGLDAGRETTMAITGLATLQAYDPEGFATLLEVLTAATAERSAAGRPLVILVDTVAPGLRVLPP